MTRTVHDLRAMMDAEDDFLLLDVRTEEELALASLPRAMHVPLHELEANLAHLEGWRGKEIVCMCHHGGRSAMAQQILLTAGFENVSNLVGGIHAYSAEVDDSIPIYE